MIIHTDSIDACTAILLVASPPYPPDYVHPSVAHLVPETWDGNLPIPYGWSVAWGFEAVQPADIDAPTQWEIDHRVVMAAPELQALLAEYAVTP